MTFPSEYTSEVRTSPTSDSQAEGSPALRADCQVRDFGFGSLITGDECVPTFYRGGNVTHCACCSSFPSAFSSFVLCVLTVAWSCWCRWHVFRPDFKHHAGDSGDCSRHGYRFGQPFCRGGKYCGAAKETRRYRDVHDGEGHRAFLQETIWVQPT